MAIDSTLSFQFPGIGRKEVVAKFDGGEITSDCGALLVGMADRKLGLTASMAQEITDRRQAAKVLHSSLDLIRQRIYAIACGHEDANDFDTLAADPAMKIACDRAPRTGRDLASQPTISRLENSIGWRDLYCMALAIARCAVGQLPCNAPEVILDLDAYEDPCHGQQELELFNGHYDSHCYLPLAMFVSTRNGGRQIPMGLMLRSGKGGNAGVHSMIRAAVDIVRERFPHARIILRADAGFGNAGVIALCNKLRISYLLGLAANRRVNELSTRIQMWACWQYTFQGKQRCSVNNPCRVFGRISYKAGTWEREEDVVVKAEITNGELNPRFVVTNLDHLRPEQAYELYCGRGDAENRIKELKLDLFAGRTSCHRFAANQLRLLLHHAAAVLMSAIQKAAEATELSCAQASSIRLRLLKIGARVIESTRRIALHMASSFPGQHTWRAVYEALVT